jgi:hypothetical protein
MNKFFLYPLAFFGLITSCGPQFYLTETKETRPQIVVSAYTQDGCIEELHQEAKQRGLEVL